MSWLLVYGTLWIYKGQILDMSLRDNVVCVTKCFGEDDQKCVSLIPNESGRYSDLELIIL